MTSATPAPSVVVGPGVAEELSNVVDALSVLNVAVDLNEVIEALGQNEVIEALGQNEVGDLKDLIAVVGLIVLSDPIDLADQRIVVAVYEATVSCVEVPRSVGARPRLGSQFLHLRPLAHLLHRHGKPPSGLTREW